MVLPAISLSLYGSRDLWQKNEQDRNLLVRPHNHQPPLLPPFDNRLCLPHIDLSHEVLVISIDII